MKVAVLAAVVLIGGFFMAKLTLEFLDILLEKLKEENRED
jgi:hypothetical protein